MGDDKMRTKTMKNGILKNITQAAYENFLKQVVEETCGYGEEFAAHYTEAAVVFDLLRSEQTTEESRKLLFRLEEETWARQAAAEEVCFQHGFMAGVKFIIQSMTE